MQAGSLKEILIQFGVYLDNYPPPLNIAIKINLSSPPTKTSPKSDAYFLKHIMTYLLQKGYSVTLIEGANGYLRDNLDTIGLGQYLENPLVHWIDLDNEKDVIFIKRRNRIYPIPKVLTQMDLRIAVPCATKRQGFLFSCNIKTFVGILPRAFCQNGKTSIFSRPMIHEDLTETVSDLFLIVREVIPFHFFLNGGNTISDSSDIRQLPEYYCSSDPLELDEYIATVLKVKKPGYMLKLREVII